MRESRIKGYRSIIVYALIAVMVCTGWPSVGHAASFTVDSARGKIAAGALHSVALKSDGSVVAWGNNSNGQCNVPSGLTGAVDVVAGNGHNLALKSDGTVAAWGYNGDGQSNVPSGLTGVKAIAAGTLHSLILKSDETVVAWGHNGYGQSNVPSGLTGVKAIAAGYFHSLALKSDGTVVAWGYNSYGQSNVPAGLTGVVAIAAGSYHSLALKSDGTVVAWGYNNYGQSNVPAGLNLLTQVPVSNDHSFTINQNTTGTGTLTATDADGDPLTYLLVSPPSKGIASVSNSGSYTYTPYWDVTGIDTFQYQVNDGTVSSNVATVTVNILSNNADLSSLTISKGTLSPAFSSDQVNYSVRVLYEVDQLTITPMVEDSTATLKINSASTVSGIGKTVDLNVGSNEILVEVTSQAGTQKTYTVLVTRAPQSSNSDLSNLTISQGTLSPSFSSGTTEYTASVGNEITSLEITPTVADGTATLQVNTADATSGSARMVNLDVGDNEIVVDVTAQNGATKTYKVTVTRAKSSNADLSNLTISEGTLTPSFSADTTEYSASVGNEITSLEMTPTLADGTATLQVNTADATSGSARTVSLNVGDNEILVDVTAQNGATKTYKVTVTRAESSNADLSNLTISQGTLSPSFSADTTEYTASVGNEITSLEITPTVADGTATLQVNTADATSGSARMVNLDVGDNEIVVDVTAQNGATKTYKVTVTRAKSSNADLSSLTISEGTLSPSFSAGTTEYTASVENEITSLDITPTVADGTATLKVNTADATSGNARTVNLNVGDNEILIEVTAQNGTTKTYKVTVTRAKSSNADLSSLTISEGTLSPSFSAGTTEYTASVENEITSLEMTPTVADGTATLKVNTADATSGNARTVSLNVGDNEISIEVTAQNGTTKTYKVTVTRAESSNADLSSLTISEGTLSPSFSAGTTEYTASVENEITSLDITPTVADGTATLKVNTADATSGNARTVSLNVGDNEISIEVTAQNGTTKTYKVTVTRAKSSNADLSNLTISQGTLSPSFSSGTTEYTASVGNEITSLEITPTVADGTATLQVNTADATSGSARTVSLNVGDNEILVDVTAQNGATKTYKVTVTRAESSNADLSNLTISQGTLSPSFSADTTEYTASVGNEITSLEITPTVADGTATLQVNTADATSGSARMVSLNVGDNEIVVDVTAQNGATKTYKVTVTRLGLSDEEAVMEAQKALEVGFAEGDSSGAVTKNVILPTGGLNETAISWTSDKPNVIAPDGTVTRPKYSAGDSAVVLTALIAKNGITDTKTFTLTVKATEAQFYTLTVENGTGSGSYEEGVEVAIVADAPPEGKEFDKWIGGDGGVLADATSSSTTFTMPADAATVTATYKIMAPALMPSIELSQTDNHDFGSVIEGYSPRTPFTVLVNNTGTGATGDLTVELGGSDASAFALSKTTIGSIGASGSDNFTVVPNNHLLAGSFSATVAVYGDNVAPQRFTVSFTVTTTPPEIPTAPANVSSVAGDGQVTLNWEAVTGADHYSVYQYEGTAAPTDETDWNLVQASVTSATYTVTNLTNGTSYAFAVKAIGAGGTSGFSAATLSTPTASLPPAPTAPAKLIGVAGDGQVTLNWEAVTGADHYSVYQYEGTAAPTDETDWNLVQASVTLATYTVTGLTNGTSYTFAVKAIGPGGTSGFSEAATATLVATGGNGVVGGGGNSPSHVTSANGAIAIPVGSSGEVGLNDEISIQVPVGAAEQELRITIEYRSVADIPSSTQEAFASSVFEVLKNVAGAFKKPVKLSIKFDPAKVGSDRKASIHYYDEEKKTWREVGGTVDGEWITVEVDHFTKYAVLAIEANNNVDEETVTEPIPSFTDIAGHWGEQSIVRAATLKLVSGYLDGTFKPNAPVTRAEFTVMLASALKLDGTGVALAFKDEAKIGAWAKQAVALAVQEGIVTGDGGGNFRPEAKITRAEMAAMIAKALNVSPEANAITGFADDKDIPKWAKGSAEAIRELGIVSGRGGNSFAPNGAATRAEAVVMLLRLLEVREQ
ncbi:cadherin-like beta sandwich domain-containing protein [Cohnella xylanilytica]|uniref:Cadherin-like beta sandwich domain-containing protein n=1 Tax=Cohnella xylanilytica TaxID=557555 RepID=A0A841U8S9_9BACL|nr:cadherin-like beta sandwich domain-containing protein [Cohnella xylanilytica]MBB6694421.1 cadherin-like beta sandwich domain-containing protein [Cohnella xylanilytica]